MASTSTSTSTSTPSATATRPSAPHGAAAGLPSRLLGLVAGTGNDYGALASRLALGLVIFPHGAQKALGWFGGYGFSGTMAFFTQQMHIPAPFALLAIAAEFLGALGLITGLLGRVAAFGVGFTMLVAMLTVHLPNGFFMNWFGAQKGEGIEFFILAIGLAVAVMIKGSGALSLDRLLTRRNESR